MNKVALITFFALIFSLSSCSNGNNNKTDNGNTNVSKKEYTREKYSNPLNFYKQDGSKYYVYCADPDVIRCDEDNYYYMYCTNTDCEMGDKGIMYDRSPIFRSRNLIDWTWCGSVFDGLENAANWGTKDAGVWAPSVIKVGNQYNYYYALSTWGDPNPGIGVATSSTPYGPWIDHGKLLDSVDSGVKNSIDPQALYVDGKLYLVWGSFFGIGIIELTEDGLEPYVGYSNLKEYTKYIIKDNTTDGKMDIDINYEGSYIIEKDNNFYYFGSQGTCLSGTSSTYRVKVGVSDSVFGPYKGSDKKDLDDVNGSFGDLVIAPSDEVAGTGHNTIIKDFDDRYWIIYHGYDIKGENPTNRIPFIDELLWDNDTKMPYVKNRKASIHEEKLGPTILKYKE